jgi:hypothetical protein
MEELAFNGFEVTRPRLRKHRGDEEELQIIMGQSQKTDDRAR